MLCDNSHTLTERERKRLTAKNQILIQKSSKRSVNKKLNFENLMLRKYFLYYTLERESKNGFTDY